MKVGDKIVILVGEPWDFDSSMGANRISGTICDYTLTKKGEAFLFESDDMFDIQSVQVRYMVLKARYKKHDNIHYNISYIPDEWVSKFQKLDEIEGVLLLIIIGSIEEQANLGSI